MPTACIAALVLIGLTATRASAADPPPAPPQPPVAVQPPATSQPAASQPDVPPKPRNERFVGQLVDNIEKTRFPEPSGLVFHPIRKTLFLVSDVGEICEMNTDGKILKRKKFPSNRRLDCEGVTVNPADGLLYVAVEGDEAVLEVDPETLDAKRRFQIERTFQGKVVMAPGGNGIEAIAFLPDPNHPHGGTFLVANQSFSLTDPKDLSAVFEVEVPLKSAEVPPLAAKILRSFSLGVTDLSAMHYDAARKRLFVVSDANNLLFETTLAGQVVVRYLNFPGVDQEGLALDQAGHIYIAQDSGGVLKIKWAPTIAEQGGQAKKQ